MSGSRKQDTLKYCGDRVVLVFLVYGFLACFDVVLDSMVVLTVVGAFAVKNSGFSYANAEEHKAKNNG